MPRYLLISDVYCPWCFAFGPVLDALLKKHPFPVRVLAGCLVDEARSVADMAREHPALPAFFERLARTAGRGAGPGFLSRLEGNRGESLVMDSAAMAGPLQALKILAPGREREQMDALQAAFYGEGLDVLSPAVQARVCGVEEAALASLSGREDIREAGRAAMAEALDILDEFVVYPTLFLEGDDGSRHLLARGWTLLPGVEERLEKALAFPGCRAEEPPDTGHACGPDGCLLP